ncbi:MAG: 6-bladed beta-propeller [Gemmatimonadota bacterium]
MSAFFQVAATPPRQIELRVDASCRSCKMEVIRGPRLGETEGPGSFSGRLRDGRKSRGRYVVSAYTHAGGSLLVFDSGGKFLRRVTREGSGPGESRSLGAFAIGPGDSIWLADALNMRVNVYDPEYRFVRSTHSPGAALAHGLLVTPSWIIANGTIRSSDRLGYALHFFGPDLKLARSADLDPVGYRPELDRKTLRPMAPRRSGGFWAAEHGAYRIHRYDDAGESVETLFRRVSWFEPHDPGPQRDVSAAKTLIHAIHEDDDGLLWVLMSTSDTRNWRSAIRPPGTVTRGGRASPYAVITDVNRFYDSIVEVIDPMNGTIVRTARFDVPMHIIAGEREFVSEEVDADGRIFARIWRVALQP